MKTIFEGEKRNIAAKVRRTDGSTAAITLTSPQRRILNANKAVVSGFDWGGATWDSATNKILALFDSTAAGLTSVGTYFVQLRGVIGNELYGAQVTVNVKEWGP